MSTDTKPPADGNGDSDAATFRRDATVMEIATVIANSRDFPDCRTPEKAAVRIMAGREMGVGPIASVIGIRVQAGRVSMDATLMAGCIKRSSLYDYTITGHDDQYCSLDFFEIDRLKSTKATVGKSVFTWDHAKKAGLDKKDTWKSYPRNMLFARALSNGARWYCPAIFGGAVYTHEELGYAVDEEGRATEAAPGVGGELCTRDQRQQIAQLVEALGDSLTGYLATIGVKLLDELSGYEAGKEIEKLAKKLEKKNGKPAAVATAELPRAIPSDPPLSAAQQTIAGAFADAAKPSTARQRDEILTLAEKLIPNEGECLAALTRALAKRGVKKIAELDYLAANAWIEELQEKLTQPPFAPTPATGK